MAITPLPVPVPQTSDPTNFNTRADAFMTALPTFGTEANTLATDVNNKQTLAASSQAAALTSETNALASANAAAAASAATLWVSGTTYAAGDTRFSPTDYRSYRRTTAGAGTTDPISDATNWRLISNGPDPFLHVREEQSVGTGPGNSVGTGANQRVLNTVLINTIVGASLASNIITLPAGTYDFDASAPIGNGSGASHRLCLNNITDSTNIFGSGAAAGNMGSVTVKSRFVITTTKTFKLNHYISTNGTAMGNAVNLGVNEVYSEVRIWKVA